ncbi:hypothetical protein [Bradyrhizobium australafricanum]|uniref:hypothetical protein n=1 Tax=Bradyrhizobium australafricanum TaxID=2821406 RepID=UPI001CE349AA|nr:hypothetical protein [Bradyrhizobium australafricanum]MCA6104736.1 hypothetical protein [Bradyrhizobium australafricanum]
MFIEIALDILTYSEDSYPERKAFWHRFLIASRDQPFPDDVPAPTRPQIEAFEQRFRVGFPAALQRLINDEVQRAYSRWRVPRSADIELRIASLEYGSLKPILDITGIDSVELRDFVLSLLTIYAPLAFREALGEPDVIQVVTPAKVVGEDLKVTDTQPTGRSKGRQALDLAWGIANTSLLVPVGLALTICYYAFSAVNHELDALRIQAASLQSERTEILKTLQAQNTKLSDLLLTHASNADKVLSEILVAAAKSASDRSTTPVKPSTGSP